MTWGLNSALVAGVSVAISPEYPNVCVLATSGHSYAVLQRSADYPLTNLDPFYKYVNSKKAKISLVLGGKWGNH